MLRSWSDGVPDGDAEARDSDRPTLMGRTPDHLALIDAERKIAETGRSGVRAVAPVVLGTRPRAVRGGFPVAVDGVASAPSNARAVDGHATPEIDAIAPGELAGPGRVSSPEPFLLTRSATTASLTDIEQPKGSLETRQVLSGSGNGSSNLPQRGRTDVAVAPRRGGRLRRFLVRTLFVLVMFSALGLLLNALERRGVLHVPNDVKREVVRLVQRFQP